MSKTKGAFRSLPGLLLVMLAVLAGCQKGPSTPEEYIDLGQQYLQELNYEEALAAFNEAIELDANCAGAYLGHGQVYLATERYTKALADFDKALTLEPDSAEAYAGRAEANEALGNLAEALADYEKAVELDPAREAELAPKIDALREALRPKTYAEQNGLTFSPAEDFTTISCNYPGDASAFQSFEAPVTFDEVSLADNGDGTLTATVTTTMRGQIQGDMGYNFFGCISLSLWDEYTGHTIPAGDGRDLYGDDGFSAGGAAYVVEWQGESYAVTASQEANLVWPAPEIAYFTCSVHVTYPQGYDGLCFSFMNMPAYSAQIQASLEALEDGHYLMDDPTWNADWHLFRFSDLLAAFG